MFRKIFFVLLFVFTILFIPNLYAVEDDIYDNIRISIDDYDELSSVQGWNYYTGEEITNFDDFLQWLWPFFLSIEEAMSWICNSRTRKMYVDKTKLNLL